MFDFMLNKMKMTVVTFVWLPARAGPVSKHKVPPIWRVPGRETLDKDIGSTTTTHITMKHFLPYKRSHPQKKLITSRTLYCVYFGHFFKLKPTQDLISKLKTDILRLPGNCYVRSKWLVRKVSKRISLDTIKWNIEHEKGKKF